MGTSECLSCADMGGSFLTTRNYASESPDSCVCPAGNFRVTSAVALPAGVTVAEDGSFTGAELTVTEEWGLSYSCQKCPSGYWCPVGADPRMNFGELMRVRPGHFVKDTTSTEALLKIFQCDVVVFTSLRGDHTDNGYDRSAGERDDTASSLRCPGTDARVPMSISHLNGTQCGPGFDGEADLCGRCAAGRFSVEGLRKCEDCSGTNQNTGLTIALMFIGIFLAPFVFHLLFNSVTTEYGGILLVQFTFGLFITSNQLATVY